MIEKYEFNILSEDSTEIDIILGHGKTILSDYRRNNIKLVGGWYYRNIKTNIAYLEEQIKAHNFQKINLIGASKSCSGCIILGKEIAKLFPHIKINLFMFSAYTTVDKNVYIKRKIEHKAPGTLVSLWNSEKYSPRLIKRMEARTLIEYNNITSYLFYPSLSRNGERQLAERIKGKNIKHISLPVYLHNSLYPFWAPVKQDKTIEIYENEYREMHKDDYGFYRKMQSYEAYKFHLYSILEKPEYFMQQINMFKSFYSFFKEKKLITAV